MALVQAIVLLPPMIAGSFCQRVDGVPGVELGVCVCAVVSAGAEEPILASPDTPECGPCHDQAIRALTRSRSSGNTQPLELVLIPIQAARTPALGSRGSAPEPTRGDLPGTPLSILRC